MKTYSEKQLLLLSNLVYLPCSLSNKNISNMLDDYRDSNGVFTVESVQAAGVGGGLSNEDVCTLFREIEAEIQKDSEFGNLSASRKLDDGYVRAICYTDKNDSNPVVVYRGTGGTKAAWTDNFEGGYQTDTKMQQLAADFLNNECSKYNNVTVTGHSKGGNMSAYVTVMCGEKVARCVSFDGQGFNNDFIGQNREKVEAAINKIKSISAYNDFVNILLTPIAKDKVYVNNENSIVAAHSSLSMLMNNNFDANGNITSSKEQSPAMKCLKDLADNLVNKIATLDDGDKRIFSYVTGSTIATALETGNIENAGNTIASIGGIISSMLAAKMLSINKLLHGQEQLYATSLYISGSCMNEVSYSLTDTIAALCNIKERLMYIENNLAFNSAAQLYVRRKINSILSEIDRIVSGMRSYVMTLEEICRRYEAKEKEICHLIG